MRKSLLAALERRRRVGNARPLRGHCAAAWSLQRRAPSAHTAGRRHSPCLARRISAADLCAADALEATQNGSFRATPVSWPAYSGK